MTVELPKDAKGREIPLDTSEMFISDGTMVHIVRFEYMHYTCDARGSWYVHINRTPGEHMTLQPCDVHLTKPDSIKQLAEDLNRAWDVGNAQEKGCRYMSCYYDNNRGAHCNDCRLNSHGKMSCLDRMMADIISRVNRLAGDSE